jgi:hypothetical protein
VHVSTDGASPGSAQRTPELAGARASAREELDAPLAPDATVRLVAAVPDG